MLRSRDLIDKLGEEYRPMISQISIADFTKCIAQFANYPMDKLSDAAIEDYLTKWATNKKRFFDLMGGKIKVDFDFTYMDEDRDYASLLRELGLKYPAFWPWLRAFRKGKTNKVETGNLDWWSYDFLDIIDDSRDRYEGMSLTRFFKKYLKANDEFITELGRVYENNEVSAKLTISIDPVDMMLASENPYGWTSCYRLENDFEESHADGCLAAVIDDTSLISYVWNNEGKFTLYNRYDFKNIRYKRMRMWFGLSQNMTTAHFNLIYPGKSQYSNGFCAKVRDVIEKFIANKLNCENIWVKGGHCNTNRIYDSYGYDEFDSDYVWYVKGTEEQDVQPYSCLITCPCGCGNMLPGTGCEDDIRYNGYGLIAENFNEETWCEYLDEYSDCDGNCEECSVWRENNAVCELDENEHCDEAWSAEQDDHFDPYESNVVSCGDHCKGCPLYALHHPQEDPNAADEAHEEQMLNINIEG